MRPTMSETVVRLWGVEFTEARRRPARWVRAVLPVAFCVTWGMLLGMLVIRG